MSCDGNCNDCSSKCAEQAPPVPAEKRPEGGCAPSKCDSCPSKGNCGSTSIINDEITKISKRISKFGSVLLILSGKGGVGKSTVAT